MCSTPNCNKPTINRKYNLCNDCNYIRLNGKSRQQTYQERNELRPKKTYQLKSHKPIKQQTQKEFTQKKELSQVKREIELEAVQNGTYYCKGCGISYVGLDKSHIVSVGKRKDLELEKDNINLLCRDCHEDWESGDIIRMIRLQCFEKDLKYIQEKDLSIYGIVINKVKQAQKWANSTENHTGKYLKNILKKFGEKVA